MYGGREENYRKKPMFLWSSGSLTQPRLRVMAGTVGYLPSLAHLTKGECDAFTAYFNNIIYFHRNCD